MWKSRFQKISDSKHCSPGSSLPLLVAIDSEVILRRGELYASTRRNSFWRLEPDYAGGHGSSRMFDVAGVRLQPEFKMNCARCGGDRRGPGWPHGHRKDRGGLARRAADFCEKFKHHSIRTGRSEAMTSAVAYAG